MKNRRYHITLNHHEENLSGLRCTEIQELRAHVPPLTPTLANIRTTVQHLFPSYEIDERWQTLAEQRDDLDLFSVSVRPVGREVDEFESYSIGFMEV